MQEVQFPAIGMVGVHHVDDGRTPVGELAEELPLDDLPAPRPRIPLVHEELVPVAELLGQVLVHEGHVVVDAPHEHDLLGPLHGTGVPGGLQGTIVASLELRAVPASVPAILDVEVELEADLVGIEGLAPAEGTGHRLRVVDDLLVREDVLRHDLAVPVGGPPLVHDLRDPLGSEVQGLLPDDVQDFPLPRLERGMIEQESHQVAHRLARKAPGLLTLAPQFLALGLHEFRRIDVRVHVVAGAQLGRRLRLVLRGLRRLGARLEFRVEVDQILEAEGPVQEALDRLLSVAVHEPADLGGVVRHPVDHLPVGLAEPHVVLEEVAVAVDVGDDQLVLHQAVRAEQVGVAGVVVDDEFVDLLQPVPVALADLLVLHPVTPVRVARREAAVAGHLVELRVIQHLEDDGKAVEAQLGRDAVNALLDVAEFGREIHLPLPRKSLMESRIASRSVMELVTTSSSSSNA